VFDMVAMCGVCGMFFDSRKSQGFMCSLRQRGWWNAALSALQPQHVRRCRDEDAWARMHVHAVQASLYCDIASLTCYISTSTWAVSVLPSQYIGAARGSRKLRGFSAAYGIRQSAFQDISRRNSCSSHREERNGRLHIVTMPSNPKSTLDYGMAVDRDEYVTRLVRWLAVQLHS